MKKILLTCTDLMAVQFFMEHIDFWSEKGYAVDLICSPVGNRYDEVKQRLSCFKNVSVRPVNLHRSPLKPANLIGFKQMKSYITSGDYDLIITNEPVMGFVTRLAAQKSECKVIYIAHGFHFYKGTSFIHNLIYRSIEGFAARYTDVLVTINKEDFDAANKFKLKKDGVVEFINGIGVNLSNFSPLSKSVRNEKRAELGIDDDEVAIAVVGELNKNKNQQVLIKGLAETQNSKIKMFFMGKGTEKEALENLAKTLNVNEQVTFLGYRKDLPQLLSAFDIGSSASIREGLGLNIIEEMSCGLPIIASKNRGHWHIEKANGGYLFDLNDPKDYANKVLLLFDNCSERIRIGKENIINSKIFDIEKIKEDLLDLIEKNITN